MAPPLVSSAAAPSNPIASSSASSPLRPLGPLPRPTPSVPPRTVPSPAAGDAASRPAELAELGQARQELGALKSEVAELKSERQTLQADLAAAQSKLAKLEAAQRESEQRRQQGDDQAEVVAGLRAQVTELEGKVAHNASLRARIAELEETTARMQELEFHAEELAERLAERDSLVGVLQSQLVTLPPASASVNDDLKNIRGVGPKYEKGLRALGITTYRQIADWTTADIELFAGKLRIKPERIVREDWVGRARKLLGG
jgi:predicted flap endonuclease-1-like 5' DNA nuclease